MHWKVGKVKITKVVELETTGSTRFILPLATNEEIQKLPWLIPHFATEEGRLKMSIHSLVLEDGKRRIVVDTGLGNDKQGRSIPTWNDRKGPFLETLTAAGFAPDSIDTVLCTHLHVDHVGWNTKLTGGQWVPTFANARYLFGKSEYEYWRDHSIEPAHIAVFNDSVKPIMDAGKADLIASDAEITDEIAMIPTPGHSPGHMSIHIRSDGEEGLLTGDVAVSMPPHQLEYHGRELVARFLAATGLRPARRSRLIPTRANGQPAFGLYVREPQGTVAGGNGILVLTLAGSQISAVTGFPDQRALRSFGLPPALPG